MRLPCVKGAVNEVDRGIVNNNLFSVPPLYAEETENEKLSIWASELQGGVIGADEGFP